MHCSCSDEVIIKNGDESNYNNSFNKKFTKKSQKSYIKQNINDTPCCCNYVDSMEEGWLPKSLWNESQNYLKRNVPFCKFCCDCCKHNKNMSAAHSDSSSAIINNEICEHVNNVTSCNNNVKMCHPKQYKLGVSYKYQYELPTISSMLKAKNPLSLRYRSPPVDKNAELENKGSKSSKRLDDKSCCSKDKKDVKDYSFQYIEKNIIEKDSPRQNSINSQSNDDSCSKEEERSLNSEHNEEKRELQPTESPKIDTYRQYVKKNNFKNYYFKKKTNIVGKLTIIKNDSVNSYDEYSVSDSLTSSNDYSLDCSSYSSSSYSDSSSSSKDFFLPRKRRSKRKKKNKK